MSGIELSKAGKLQEAARYLDGLRKMAPGAAITSIAVLLVALQLIVADRENSFLEAAICFSAIAIPAWVALWHATDTVDSSGLRGVSHSVETGWSWISHIFYLSGGVSTSLALWFIIANASSLAGWLFIGMGLIAVITLVLHLRSLESFEER